MAKVLQAQLLWVNLQIFLPIQDKCLNLLKYEGYLMRNLGSRIKAKISYDFFKALILGNKSPTSTPNVLAILIIFSAAGLRSPRSIPA